MSDFDAVGDEIAGYEAVASVGRALGESVGHGGCSHDQALGASPTERFDGQVRDATDSIVATVGVGERTGHGDHQFELGG